MTHKEIPRNVTAKSSSSKQQAACIRYSFEVQTRQDAPAHQLQVQVDSLVSQAFRINGSIRRLVPGVGAMRTA